MKWSESTSSIHMQNSSPPPHPCWKKNWMSWKYYRKFSRVKKFACHFKVMDDAWRSGSNESNIFANYL